MGKKTFCCVPFCPKSRAKNPSLSFFRIPKETSRRDAWLRAIKRYVEVEKANGSKKLTPWQPSDSARICGQHFVSGSKNDDSLSVDFVPSIFPNRPWDKYRAERKDRRIPAKKHAVQQRHRESSLAAQNTNSSGKAPQSSEKENVNPQGNTDVFMADHDYLCTRKTTGDGLSKEVEERIKHLEEQLAKKSEELDKISRELDDTKSKVLCLANIKQNEELVRYYTGFKTYGTFKSLFEYLEEKAKNLKYYRGKESAVAENQSEETNRSGRNKLMELEEEYFMVLVRLRRGFGVFDMSRMFGISMGHFSKVFNTWVNFLRDELIAITPFPSQDLVKETLPEAFHKFDAITRVIVDCTELYCEKPSALGNRKQLFSDYKSGNTIKFMVGLSPLNAITFVSNAWGGRASDKKITTECGILGKLDYGDGFMADKGWKHFEAKLTEYGVELIMPNELRDKAQLPGSEVTRSRRVSELRIQIERAIGRIKEFQILGKQLRLSMKDTIESIFQVCAFLTNFHGPMVKPH